MKLILSLLIISTLCLIFSGMNACGVTQSKEPETDIQDSVPPPYRIAYNVLVDEENYNYDVFTMNPDGSNKKNITRSEGVEWVYNSYGNRLYIFSDIDTCRRCFSLYETDANGSYFKKISNLILADSWIDSRRNGQEWIVKVKDKAQNHFTIINLDGKIVDEVFIPLGYANDPIFSKDGKSIVFRGSAVASKLQAGYQEELYEYNLTNNQLKQLTDYPKNDHTASLFDYRAGPPRRMKNGEISYSSKQKGNYSIFVYNPLLDISRQITSDTLNEVWHDWSDDNNLLFFDVEDTTGRVRYNIYALDLTNQSLIKLTDSTYNFNQAPVFVLPPDTVIQKGSDY